MNKNNANKINKWYEEDHFKPCEGIKTVLFLWMIFFLIGNFLMAQTNQWMLKILDAAVPFIIYLILILKGRLSLKERTFLKGFTIYPFLSLLLTLGALFNGHSIYLALPLSYVVELAAIYSIYSYFHKKKYICLMALNMIFIILKLFINISQSLFMNNVMMVIFLFLAVWMMKEEI